MFVMAWGDDLLSYSDSRQGGQALVVTPCWFHLLTLFGAGARLQVVWPGMLCSDLAGRPEHLGRASASSLRWGGRLQTPPIVEYCLRSQRASTIPPPSPLYTLLLCRSCSFNPQLFLKRNSCMYRWTFQCAHGRRRVQWPPVPHHFRPLPFSSSCLTLLKFFFDLSCLPFQFYLLPPFVPFPHYLQFARYAVLYFASVKF